MDLAMVATDWAYHIVAPVDLAGLPPEGAEVPTMLRGPGMFGNIVSVSARGPAQRHTRGGLTDCLQIMFPNGTVETGCEVAQILDPGAPAAFCGGEVYRIDQVLRPAFACSR